ncbi:hypothetical protein [Streptomyces tubercidicus]|uniref:hypothetical protein n=1 Tax=Streptomyces tubercidicus TaxID=47759 RepID=UPI00369CE132
MAKTKQVVPDLDRLLESWRKGMPVIALSEKTGISTRILSACLREEMDVISDEKVLLFLSEADDECTWQDVNEAVGEKRLYEIPTLVRLDSRGLVATRWVADSPGQWMYGVYLYRLTAAGWAAVQGMEKKGGRE